jgi:hypothetical protein
MLEKVYRSGDNAVRRHTAQTAVVPFRTYALIAKPAGHVFEEHAAGNAPGGMLRIGQGVEIDHGR